MLRINALRANATVLAVGFAVTVLVAIALIWWLSGTPLGVDSAVYRAGGSAVLHGEPLYDHLTALPGWAPELPFTYPPFAALLFVPLTALPAQWCWGLLAIAAAPSLHVALRPFTERAYLPLLLLGAFALQPVWQTIGLGQVNLLLMAVVVADVLLLRESRFRGIGIGLAAAVKLIPLIFIVHLVLVRRFADAARALAAFLGATTLAFVVLPKDSVRYWTSAIFNGHFAEMKGWVGNQSWQGFVARTLPEGGVATVLIGCFGVLCAGVMMWLVRRLHRAGDDPGALLVTAGCALLVSPISWTHHWVWVVPALGYLCARRPAMGMAAVVFTGWTVAVVPGGGGTERTWNLGQAVVGNAYLIAALALLFVLGRRSSGEPAEGQDDLGQQSRGEEGAREHEQGDDDRAPAQRPQDSQLPDGHAQTDAAEHGRGQRQQIDSGQDAQHGRGPRQSRNGQHRADERRPQHGRHEPAGPVAEHPHPESEGQQQEHSRRRTPSRGDEKEPGHGQSAHQPGGHDGRLRLDRVP
ncbi:alpha-1,2-mannosyltransferase [Amycolatopsis keratiniphila]|uniref:Alpha-1,2-mannosyltransferase n=1 Tax=Amycolatopsis keratiniphila TaxID=129921 RepID=R4T9M5_9PSEU|nr:alpha-1,2-mannosyltransferase [Amycolatopsis keratiniphila]